MTKTIPPDTIPERAKKSRLAIWSLIVVIVLTVFALIFAFFVFSTTNPTNQNRPNIITSTEETSATNAATEENHSTNTSTTYLTEKNDPIDITPVFWGMLLIFFSVLFFGLRKMTTNRYD